MQEKLKTFNQQYITTFNVDAKMNLNLSSIMTFLTFFMIIPFIWYGILGIIRIPSIFENFTNAFTFTTDVNLILNYFSIIVIDILFPLIGCLILIFKLKAQIFSTGLFYIFLVTPGRTILSLILGSFFTDALLDRIIFNFIFSFLIGLAIVLLITFRNKNIFQMVKKVFGQSKSFLISLAWTIVAYGAFLLINLIMNSITNAIVGSGGSSSGNQQELTNMLADPFGVATLFFSSVIVAPFLEEYIYRMYMADVTNNKWYSWIITALFFAFLHIKNFGDWQYIFQYLSLGIVNGIIYWKFKNITIPIVLHFVGNLSSFVFLLL